MLAQRQADSFPAAVRADEVDLDRLVRTETGQDLSDLAGGRRRRELVTLPFRTSWSAITLARLLEIAKRMPEARALWLPGLRATRVGMPMTSD